MEIADSSGGGGQRTEPEESWSGGGGAPWAGRAVRSKEAACEELVAHEVKLELEGGAAESS